MYKKFCYIVLVLLIISCTNTVNIKNERAGKLIAAYQLVENNEKKILLDYETAPKPPYMQIIKGANGEQVLTFLNPHKNAIYFYDYVNAIYTGRIEYEREGPNGILRLAGYYIKNMDSIYVFNRPLELALTDSFGVVKQRISLNNNRTDREWPRYFPQYSLSTINPLVETDGKIIMTGMSPFSIADSLINKFKFTASMDMKSGNLEFIHIYPDKLYGSDVNWQNPYYMQSYRELSPTGDWLYSFPVSHNLYITNRNAKDYKQVYAGSNTARTIRSINDKNKRTPNEVILIHTLKQDLYNAILHDSYRKVYYRFMLKGLPDTTIKTNIIEKPIAVIIMDEQFNYMGETVIGTGEQWNWENSFVTREGLNIEYISKDELDEDYMTLKIFTIEKIDK